MEKKPEDVRVVTGRIMCETSGVCFRVAVKEEKEISWLIKSWLGFFFFFRLIWKLVVVENLSNATCPNVKCLLKKKNDLTTEDLERATELCSGRFIGRHY